MSWQLETFQMKWKYLFLSFRLYFHKTDQTKTISIGIFHRCENVVLPMISTSSKIHTVCFENKYFFGSAHCNSSKIETLTEETDAQRVCNLDKSTCNCDYSSYGKGLISCTIIAACTLGVSFLLIFTHLLINEFKDKLHFYLAVATIVLLSLGFIFLLITLILLGSTMAFDLYQYRFDLNNRELLGVKPFNSSDSLRTVIVKNVDKNYDIRLDWAGGLEIIALILSGFTLLTQVLYLISTRRNHTG